MYEVELTAVVNKPKAVFEILTTYDANYSTLVYDDSYYDQKNLLATKEQELRIRIKKNLNTGSTSSYLTLKDTPFDVKTKSKPEYETQIDNPEAAAQLLNKLGYDKKINYQKNIQFFTFDFSDKPIEVSLVTLPELTQTFIELETQVNESSQTDNAFKVLYKLLEILAIEQTALTTEYYQQMVKKARLKSS